MKNFFSSMFTDENNTASSKRIAGIICIICLNATLIANSFSHGDIKPSDTLVNAVAAVAFGCLGLTTVDKFTRMRKKIEKSSEE
jgi:predicted membrane protein